MNTKFAIYFFPTLTKPIVFARLGAFQIPTAL
jgi:hypothetical protein